VTVEITKFLLDIEERYGVVDSVVVSYIDPRSAIFVTRIFRFGLLSQISVAIVVMRRITLDVFLAAQQPSRP
jgi:hypothetical protein